MGPPGGFTFLNFAAGYKPTTKLMIIHGITNLLKASLIEVLGSPSWQNDHARIENSPECSLGIACVYVFLNHQFFT